MTSSSTTPLTPNLQMITNTYKVLCLITSKFLSMHTYLSQQPQSSIQYTAAKPINRQEFTSKIIWKQSISAMNYGPEPKEGC